MIGAQPRRAVPDDWVEAMKTIPSSHQLLPGLACLVLTLAGVSCQTSTPPTADVPKTVTRSHWVKISSHPPTFYPRGVAADSPTDHWTGEWVFTGDALGSRYFIPFRGLGKMDRPSLIHEAFSARSDKKLQQIAAEDRELRNKHLKHSLILLPLNAMGAIGGGSIDESQLEDFAGEVTSHWKEQLESDDPIEAPLAAR